MFPIEYHFTAPDCDPIHYTIDYDAVIKSYIVRVNHKEVTLANTFVDAYNSVMRMLSDYVFTHNYIEPYQFKGR